MSKGNYRICFHDGTKLYKLCRIVYGADGSFYVTVPYHPEKKGVIFMMTVNYAKQEQQIAHKDLIDLAGYEGEEQRLKYSHHASGFIQFSGAGVLSGQNDDGSAKGIGIKSWPLSQPVRGPAFALTLKGISQFETLSKPDCDDIIFNAKDLAIGRPDYQLFLEGHYFSQLWTRFLHANATGQLHLMVAHPAGGVIKMNPLLPPAKCPLQSFLAVELYAETLDGPPNCQVMLSGSTGNIRFNENNEKLGDGIYYMFPDHKIETKKTLNYTSSAPLKS